MENDIISKVDTPSTGLNIPLGIVGGLLGAGIGGGVWAIIGILTDYETSLVAMIVGALAGLGVLLLSFGKRGFIFQTIAALCAIVGIAIGKYALMYHFLSVEIGGPDAMSQLGYTPFSSEIIELFPSFLQETSEAIDILFIIVAIVIAFSIPSVRTAAKPDQTQAPSE